MRFLQLPCTNYKGPTTKYREVNNVFSQDDNEDEDEDDSLIGL